MEPVRLFIIYYYYLCIFSVPSHFCARTQKNYPKLRTSRWPRMRHDRLIKFYQLNRFGRKASRHRRGRRRLRRKSFYVVLYHYYVNPVLLGRVYQ